MSGALSGKTVIAIASGSSHTLVLTSDGKVFAWGENSSDNWATVRSMIAQRRWRWI